MNSGTTGIDDDFAARGFDTVAAWIMGRNMFGRVAQAFNLSGISFRPPFERISDPQIPLTRLKKME
jgi:dihydrofolate reductase